MTAMAETGIRERYLIDDLTLDVDAGALYRGQGEIELPRLSFDLLACLVRRAPALATRELLLDQVWPGLNVGEETLKQRVRLLRRALGDDSRNPRYILSVRGRGYKIKPAVVTAPEDPPPGPASFPRRSIGRSVSWRRLWLAIAALAAAGFFLWPSRPGPAAGESSSALSGSGDAEALLRRGRQYYRRYRPQDNEMAIELLKRAVAESPNSAPAYALLSRAYSQQPKLGNGYWPDQALQAARKAIELAPDDPGSHVSLGLYYDVAGQSSRGLEAYARALALRPDHGDAVANTACDLMYLGRLDEALDWNIRSIRLNPDVHFGMIQMALNLRLLGFDQEAEAWHRKAIALQPDHIFGRSSYAEFLAAQQRWHEALAQIRRDQLRAVRPRRLVGVEGEILFLKGDFEDAIPQLESVACEKDLQADYRRGLALARLGREAEARPLLADAAARAAQAMADGVENSKLRVLMAGVALAGGEKQEAISWLEAAATAGWTDFRLLRLDPAFSDLRGDAAFLEFLDRLRARVGEMRARVRALEIAP